METEPDSLQDSATESVREEYRRMMARSQTPRAPLIKPRPMTEKKGHNINARVYYQKKVEKKESHTL